MTDNLNLDCSHYKVVELSTVTDETIEHALNLWSCQGWQFDQIQFVVRDSSRRPSMAFVFFTKPVAGDEQPMYETVRTVSENDEPPPEDTDEEGEFE